MNTRNIRYFAVLAIVFITEGQSRRVLSLKDEKAIKDSVVGAKHIGRKGTPSLQQLTTDSRWNDSLLAMLALMTSTAPRQSSAFAVSSHQGRLPGFSHRTSHVLPQQMDIPLQRAAVQMQPAEVQEKVRQDSQVTGSDKTSDAASSEIDFNSARRFDLLYMDDTLRKVDEKHQFEIKEDILEDWMVRMQNENLANATLLNTMSDQDLKRFQASFGQVDLIDDGPNPFEFVRDDVSQVASGIVNMLAAQYGGLEEGAQFFFKDGRLGKQFRSTAVMLMAKAVAGEMDKRVIDAESTQSRLAQVTEMIHTASLVHDDVLDNSEQRRGEKSTKAALGNYPATLVGDFLLARASLILARIGDDEVTKIMAGSLEALVTGEIVQMSAPKETRLEIKSYLKKSYFKTASLIASALRSVAVLGGNPSSSEIVKAAEAYGFHVGLVFQVIDDILDFVSTSEDLGKPAMADVKLGLATAPIIYAAEEDPKLKPLILRKFSEPGDAELAHTMTLNTNGIARSFELASYHANAAKDALLKLPPSTARDALERLNTLAMERKK